MRFKNKKQSPPSRSCRYLHGNCLCGNRITTNYMIACHVTVTSGHLKWHPYASHQLVQRFEHQLPDRQYSRCARGINRLDNNVCVRDISVCMCVCVCVRVLRNKLARRWPAPRISFAVNRAHSPLSDTCIRPLDVTSLCIPLCAGICKTTTCTGQFPIQWPGWRSWDLCA